MKYAEKIFNLTREMYKEKMRHKEHLRRDLMRLDEELRDKTIPYDNYVKLKDRYADVSKELERVTIEFNVWGQAREICLDIICEALESEEDNDVKQMEEVSEEKA